jgi:Pheophorbide a oxygenase
VGRQTNPTLCHPALPGRCFATQRMQTQLMCKHTPLHCRLQFQFQRQGHFSMLFYAVPVAKGHCRLVAGYSTSYHVPSSVRAVLNSQILAPLLHSFQWAVDLGNHEVVDGDTLLLRYQVQTIHTCSTSSEKYTFHSVPMITLYPGGAPA